MGAINIIVLCQNCCAVIFELTALIIFCQIVLPISKLNKVITFNLSIKFYMWSTIFLCATSIPTHLYYIILWSDTEVYLYNAYIIWYTGVIQIFAMTAIPFTVLFLCIERCCIISIPGFLENRRERYVTIISIITIGGACLLALFLDNLPGYPKTAKTSCRNLSCIIGKTTISVYLYIRYACAFANVIIGVACVLLVRKKLKGSSTETTVNKVIFTTLLNTFIFDICPNTIDGIFLLGFQINIVSMLGAYRIFLTAMEAAICAINYHKLLIKKRESGSRTTVSVKPVSSVATISKVPITISHK